MKKWMGKKAAAVIMCLLVSLQALPFVANADAGAGTATVNLLDVTGACTPKDMFNSFGVTATSGKNELSLAFDMEMVSIPDLMAGDPADIPPALKSIIDTIEDWSSANPTGNLDTELADSSSQLYKDLPGLNFEFSFKLGDSSLSFPDTYLNAKNDLKTKANVKIGEYTITKDDGTGVFTLSGSLDKFVYNRTGETAGKGVTAGGSAKMSIKNDEGKDVTPNLELKDGIVNVSVSFSGGSTPGGGDDKPYTIEKTASDITQADSKSFLTYTITAKAPAGKTLNSMSVVDPIPEGLTVTKVAVASSTPSSITGDVESADQAEAGKYFVDTSGKLTYTIPDSPDVTEIALSVTTMMTSDNYQKYMKIQTGNPNLTFKNKASLYEKDATDPKVVSNEVTSTLEGSFMAKDGKRVGLNSPFWDWKITANTYFTGTSGTVYLIDSIQGITDTHMYALNASDQVEFTVNEETAPRSAAQATTSSPYTYADLSGSAKTADEKKNWLDTLTSSGANAVYYINGSEAVLVIPLAASDLNKPLTVTYQTKAIATSSGTYTTKALKNAVTMFWGPGDAEYNPGGGSGGSGGGGSLPSFSFNVSKDVNMNYALLTKEAGKYTPSTREMIWNFNVNYSGREIKSAIVTDVLKDSLQQFKSLRYQTITRDSSNKETPSGWAAMGKDTGSPHYTLTQNPTTHETTLEISLGDVPENVVYQLELKTTVVDPEILSKNASKAGTLSNSAEIKGEIFGEEEKQTDDASLDVANTILVKDNIDKNSNGGNYYDLDTHQLYWRVTINQNKANIKDGAVLTDTVPLHTDFGKLLKVTRTPLSGTSETKADLNTAADGSVTMDDHQVITLKDDGVDKDGRQIVQFEFSKAFNDKYELVFTTTVKEEYREEIAKKLKQYSFQNNVALAGELVDPTGVKNAAINASDDATHNVNIPSVTKSGDYFELKDYPSYGTISYAHWTIKLNRDQVDMTGARLEDQLKTWFQMIPESVAIVEGMVTSDGKDITPLNSTKITDGLTVTDGGFAFDIPAAYAKKPLIITFDTRVIDDVSANNMINSVSLKWKGGDETDSGNTNANGAKDFFAASYATAAKIPLLQVQKTDANSHTALGGADFVLSALKKSGTTWIQDTSISQKSKTTVSSTGYANFLFLKRDVLYKVVESAAPSGYMPDSRPRYFVFLKDTVAGNYPAGTTAVDASTSSYMLPFTNSQQSGTIQGKKTNTSGGALPGAVIGLFPESETVYTSAEALQTYVSDNTTGAFHFTAASGTYKIVEITPPPGYLLNQGTVYTVTVPAGTNVTVDKDVNNNAITIANTKKPTGGGGNPGGGSTSGYIVIEKSSEDGVLSGFTFEITDGKTYTERFVTDADGRIMTGELPKGTYTIHEVAVEGVTDRYELPKAQTVRLSGVGTKVSFKNKLLEEFIPPEEVPLGGGTEPTPPTEVIPDDDVPKGGKETFGPKTGYTGASPLWSLMLGLSLAGLGYSVISLLVSKKQGRHAHK